MAIAAQYRHQKANISTVCFPDHRILEQIQPLLWQVTEQCLSRLQQ